MGGYEHLALVGTTAVVALVGARMIYVANCGDSRAVLCRGGGALPLTDDHKAAREDETVRGCKGGWGAGRGAGRGAGMVAEGPRANCSACMRRTCCLTPTLALCPPVPQARVEAAGGQILFWNGVRVMGLLAVSRAIGDHSLRPYVIAEPEVRFECGGWGPAACADASSSRVRAAGRAG